MIRLAAMIGLPPVPVATGMGSDLARPGRRAAPSGAGEEGGAVPALR